MVCSSLLCEIMDLLSRVDGSQIPDCWQSHGKIQLRLSACPACGSVALWSEGVGELQVTKLPEQQRKQGFKCKLSDSG